MFPRCSDSDNKGKSNLSIALLGNRIHGDQTLMEYLIEFLLVFTSAKGIKPTSGKMQFHTKEQIESGKLPFYVDTRVALRRFVFYDRSKQDSRSLMDTAAQKHMQTLLSNQAEESEDIALIHDLLLSYATITRNRGWYAQALMPVSAELVLTDMQGIKGRQKIGSDFDLEDSKLIDSKFDFDKHNFLARGGQILYLHLLQPLANNPTLDEAYRTRLEALLTHMLTCSGREIDQLASHIQKTWEDSRTDKDSSKAYDPKPFNMGYIQDNYAVRGERFLKEVTCFLSNEIHPITRIELFAQGMVFSLLRIIHILAYQKANDSSGEPLWIMDVSGMGGTSNIARLSADSYHRAMDDFQTALVKLSEANIPESERFKKVQDGRKESSDIFHKLGKEIKLIIPPRGDYERFSLSESLVRYLVLALIEPSHKVTLDTFLNRLYDNFRIVIGPEQYRKAIVENKTLEIRDMGDYFQTNVQEFQSFLKSCGFLRDLSDATAIVENPYKEVQIP